MPEQPESRRFPLPWSIGGNDTCFWVEDAEGKRVAYVYFLSGDVPIATSSALGPPRSEALRIVRNIAKLPKLLTQKN
ncbi:MAG: hypothetical protein ABIT09_10840 [Croceibacterium sp.]